MFYEYFLVFRNIFVIMSEFKIFCILEKNMLYGLKNVLGKPNEANGGIYFCGIGGISMLSLALLTRDSGYSVMGSDVSADEETIRACREHKIPLFFSHEAENVEGCSVFIYTAAIKNDNPELIRARALGIKILTRAEFLGRIIKSFSLSIGVSGTHGKSTVTHMTYQILSECGARPTMLAGAMSAKSNKAYEQGDGGTVIYEACEYNRSFLEMKPSVAVILNIEKEHTDVYPTLESSKAAFLQFAMESDTCVLNRDCPVCASVERELLSLKKSVFTFSLCDESADVYAKNIKEIKGFYTFDAVIKGEQTVSGIKMKTPGLHNVKNAISAIAAAAAIEKAAADKIKSGIESFIGIKRRFEYIGRVGYADVYDDYAHHPTEIKATLDVAKSLGYDKILCAFQPHTYSRTYELFDGFVESLSGFDTVVVSDIFAAREKNVYGITGQTLANALKNGKYIKSFDEIYRFLLASSHPKTLILTMGAGKMNLIAKRLVYGEEN